MLSRRYTVCRSTLYLYSSEFSRTQANFSEHLLSLMTNLLLFVALHMDKKILIKVLVVAFAGVDSEKWRPLHCIKR